MSEANLDRESLGVRASRLAEALQKGRPYARVIDASTAGGVPMNQHRLAGDKTTGEIFAVGGPHRGGGPSADGDSLVIPKRQEILGTTKTAQNDEGKGTGITGPSKDEGYRAGSRPQVAMPSVNPGKAASSNPMNPTGSEEGFSQKSPHTDKPKLGEGDGGLRNCPRCQHINPEMHQKNCKFCGESLLAAPPLKKSFAMAGAIPDFLHELTSRAVVVPLNLQGCARRTVDHQRMTEAASKAAEEREAEKVSV